MVRRATLDRGAQPTAHAAAAGRVPGTPDQDEMPAGRRRKPWRGGGGRWLVWSFRAVLWAVLLIIGYRGVMAIVAPPKPVSQPTGPVAQADHGFPVSVAEAYALQFGSVYLNFSPATADERASELAAFLPSGSSAEFGWNGAGSMELQSEQVASVDVTDSQHAVITLLARASGQLIELGVPVYAADGGLSVSAEPALLPPPGRVTSPGAPSKPSDPAATAALNLQLPGFFRAYASGDPVNLRRFLASGATVTGLGGTVTYGSIAGIYVPPGGVNRTITVSVTWRVPSASAGATGSSVASAPAGLEMTYQMQVVRQSGSWYVKGIGTSLQQLASP
jgi:hypothetical protein